MLPQLLLLLLQIRLRSWAVGFEELVLTRGEAADVSVLAANLRLTSLALKGFAFVLCFADHSS